MTLSGTLIGRGVVTYGARDVIALIDRRLARIIDD